MKSQKAGSRYRQLRITATQELSGVLTYSVYAKGIHQQWDEHQCILRDAVHFPAPLMTSEDVYAALLTILREQLLPGVD